MNSPDEHAELGGHTAAVPFDDIPPSPESMEPLFAAHTAPISIERTPTPLDAIFFLLLLCLAFLLSTALFGLALHLHLWGMHDFASAARITPIALGTQLILYVAALAAAVPLFRAAWGKQFLPGLHWNGCVVRRHWLPLVGVAILCNLLAMLGNLLLPFPQHAPIDQLFGSARDAWMLFAFGVTVAPFFEEMIFRGFLLPAVASAWDWTATRLTGRAMSYVDWRGQPRWSRTAMVAASLLVSAPFALMHAAQVNQSWGPITLLYLVSLVLCAVRLTTNSLAASTLVHATYNYILFAMMMVQSGGFRHLDKL